MDQHRSPSCAHRLRLQRHDRGVSHLYEIKIGASKSKLRREERAVHGGWNEVQNGTRGFSNIDLFRLQRSNRPSRSSTSSGSVSRKKPPRSSDDSMLRTRFHRGLHRMLRRAVVTRMTRTVEPIPLSGAGL